VDAASIKVTSTTTTSAKFTWSAITDGIFNDYVIDVKDRATGKTPASVGLSPHSPQTGDEATGVTATGLTAGTRYFVSIQSQSGTVKSAASIKDFTTGAYVYVVCTCCTGC
jgi:hypothetical protein